MNTKPSMLTTKRSMSRMIARLTFLSFGIALGLTSNLASAQEARVAARLIAAPAVVGDAGMLGLELTPQEGWHTYWQNPGDAGLATRLRWSAPEGVTFSPILWPPPHAYREGDLLTYGYGSTHTLLTRVNLPADLSDDAVLGLKARWLVCKDICIPESGTFEISAGQIRTADAASREAITSATQQLPDNLDLQGRFAVDDAQVHGFIPLPKAWYADAQLLEWFSARDDTIDHAGGVSWAANDDGLIVSNPRHRDYASADQLSGVLVIHEASGTRALQVGLQPGAVPRDGQPLTFNTTSSTAINLWLALAMAFMGGLILNLMPCVFPVLTLKALSLTRAESLHARRMESLAYTAGVVLSFLLIAAILLLLRAGGAALGWGFQLQNPFVVSALAMLMLLMGLAMMGWTQIGMGFMGWGQNLTTHAGLRGAFFTGVLAVLVASPCSAPFMGGALGYAVLQPAVEALSIFAALGLGLAMPFVAIAWIPSIAQRLPRPGAWMETLKHWMAAPLFLTGLWLLWVLWRQAGDLALGLAILSFILIAASIRQTPRGRHLPKPAARIVGLLGLGLIFSPLLLPAQSPNTLNSGDWQPWSVEAVANGRAEQRLIVVDFTADWCLSCIVNERAVLANKDIQAELAHHNALLLKADWTQYDPAITEALAAFGRNGVPLYLIYPTNGEAPQVLPQILTTGVVSNAIARAVE